MKKFGRLLLMLVSTGVSPTAHTIECPLLLVASHATPIEHLPQRTIRRLYLGVPYQTELGRLQPALNTSDPMLQEVFLQKIMFMSKKSYRYVLARRMVQMREAGPPRYKDTDKLIAALNADARMISYIWHPQLPGDNQLKILLEVPCEND